MRKGSLGWPGPEAEGPTPLPPGKPSREGTGARFQVTRGGSPRSGGRHGPDSCLPSWSRLPSPPLLWLGGEGSVTPCPHPCRSAWPGPAETMGGPGSLERPQRPGDMMKARSTGPSERLEEAGLFRPGERKAQGQGPWLMASQMLTSCSLSPWRPSRPRRTSTAGGS